jgi:hypothetical protein
VSLDEFFSQGLRDAERRLPLLKPVEPRDHDRVLALARSSRVVRFMHRVIGVAAGAVESSAVVAAVRRLVGGPDEGHRWRALGVALVVAALVHIGLVVWHELPPSWLWLIVPGFAVVAGVVLMLVPVSRAEHG